ncbi:MAG TPA: CsbD family protein [Vicinamibacterales bacterium]|nr:CsbD family protein [Vicinamibacterales bacterium]
METRGKNDGTIGEEVSAIGQRTKGAAKNIVGDMIDDESMEAEGLAENAAGRARQAKNDAIDTDGPKTAPLGRYVTGLYDSPESANRAYEGLTSKHGYKADDISVMMSDSTRKKHFGDVTPGTELSGGTKAAEGLGKGAAIGGGIGAALAALFAIGTSIAIPGLGLVVAGPIAAALAGAGAGGATGGLIGALIGAGIPEDRAREYERGLNEGGILIGTRYRDDAHAKELERDFTSYGGSNVRY